MLNKFILFLIILYAFSFCSNKNREYFHYSSIYIFHSSSLTNNSLKYIPEPDVFMLEERLSDNEINKPVGFYLDSINGCISYLRYNNFYDYDSIKPINLDEYFSKKIESKIILSKSKNCVQNKNTHISCLSEDFDKTEVFLNMNNSLKARLETDTIMIKDYTKVSLNLIFYKRYLLNYKKCSLY